MTTAQPSPGTPARTAACSTPAPADAAPADAAPADSAETASSGPQPAAPVRAPRALLLDFGGVVVTTTARADWVHVLAGTVLDLAAAAGHRLERADVEASLRAGRAALSMWKNAASRRLAPRELAPREIVEDFLLADLPDAARSALVLEAERILVAKAHAVSDHRVRPGICELLAEARERGIVLGIVSNAHSGRAHREILRAEGIDGCFGVQVYSDEVGIRKPHPGMIHLAADALGVPARDAWYVGDTLDRDVVAGRRAGVGRVVITRDRRTDHPPFPVTARPDLVLETPEGLLAELRAAVGPADGAPAAGDSAAGDSADGRSAAAGPADGRTTTAGTSAGGRSVGTAAPGAGPARRPLALLLDHGGVLTTSTPDPSRDAVVGRALVDLAERCGHPLTAAEAERAVAAGWERHRERKRSRDRLADPDHRHDEVDPAELWGDLIGADLPAPLRAALRLEASELSFLLHRAKGVPSPREGAVELVRWAHGRGIVVGIVSNTISGRGVRATLAEHGVLDLIGPAAYSDEIGVRKPGREIFAAALAGLDVAPADVVYVGDKALNDGRGGREAGIGTICLLRGGKDDGPSLDRALADGLADHVLDGPGDVIGVLADRLAEPAP
ncbi:HAD family hydrolase [Brachybacterium sp. J144]|uniref:HAD family hydrolase n=1 Tax=Brachybacterium sp. J144 TaxID=3116487 RepID=UPI002E760F77|nr:HAD family hydrolase [Brachybacterium sp. J144]MEE1650657.1 HAD family hydrolase [Brachybacterium sp. J144]